MKHGKYIITTVGAALAIALYGCFPSTNSSQEKITAEPISSRVTEKPQHSIEDILSEEFIKSIVEIESRGDSMAVGSKGERGLMQIMESTWYELTDISFDSAFVPGHNIKQGTEYLKRINNYFKERSPDYSSLSIGEKQEILSAAYNGGPPRLRSKNLEISKMPKTTRNYVEEVREEHKTRKLTKIASLINEDSKPKNSQPSS